MTFETISWRCSIFNIVTFLLVFNTNFITANQSQKFTQLQRYHLQLFSKMVLNYGDFCHSEDNALMETVEDSFYEVVTKMGPNSPSILFRQLDKINEAMQKLLLTGHQFCNDSKLLYCDKTTNLCSCGPPCFLKRKLHYIRDSRGQCLYAKDTPCFPVDEKAVKHYSCSHNTNCVFTNDEGRNIDCNYPDDDYDYIGNETIYLTQCYCKSEFENAPRGRSYPDYECISTSSPLNMGRSVFVFGALVLLGLNMINMNQFYGLSVC